MRVSVNARALLPSCEGQSVERALDYVDAVLEDVRSEDRLALRAQGAGMLRNFQPADAKAAREWMRERAREALNALRSSAPTTSAVPTATGTRPVVSVEDPLGKSQSSKKSVS